VGGEKGKEGGEGSRCSLKKKKNKKKWLKESRAAAKKPKGAHRISGTAGLGPLKGQKLDDGEKDQAEGRSQSELVEEQRAFGKGKNQRRLGKFSFQRDPEIRQRKRNY